LKPLKADTDKKFVRPQEPHPVEEGLKQNR